MASKEAHEKREQRDEVELQLRAACLDRIEGFLGCDDGFTALRTETLRMLVHRLENEEYWNPNQKG
jgi:hypothetical protein